MGFQIGKKCSRGFLSLVLAGKHVWCFEERDLVLVVGFHQWEPDCSLPCTAVQPHSPPCCHPEGSNHFSFDAQVQVKPLLWQQLTQTCSASPHHRRFGSYSGLCKLMLCTQCGPLPPAIPLLCPVCSRYQHFSYTIPDVHQQLRQVDGPKHTVFSDVSPQPYLCDLLALPGHQLLPCILKWDKEGQKKGLPQPPITV